MGLNQPCTGEVVGVAHLGQCMVTNVWLTLDNAWSQMRGLNHSTASDTTRKVLVVHLASFSLMTWLKVSTLTV